MEKKVPWHQRWRGVNRGIYCHFCQKNAFFGQKMTVFWKVHFKQKLSVAQNTVFKWVKNIFLLFHPKLVFFTRFYLDRPSSDYSCLECGREGSVHQRLPSSKRTSTVARFSTFAPLLEMICPPLTIMAPVSPGCKYGPVSIK